MNSWNGRASARDPISCAEDGRAALSGELAGALARVRVAARSAANAESHERRSLDLKDVIGEARIALALSASLEAHSRGERVSEAKIVAGPSQEPPSGARGNEWLVRTVVHDLNNMLLVIQNCAEAMKHQPALVVREASVVDDAVAQATRLVAKLLPPDSTVGRLPGTDLSQAVLTFSGVIRSLVGEHVSVVTRLASGLPPARCEETAIGRVLSNLATNARDAMPDGGTLTLETREQSARPPEELDGESRPFAVLTVSDTGRGMDPETRGKAFEPFFTTKPAGKGTGVGLATVREIVNGAGGFVEIETGVGRGTSVSVYLPCLKPAH
ncbi:MAG TPA: ATP-binding protein [Polyangiaceae bacterium]|nr:ATP-binding protein [Polyangiaceae bacterium]